jgi:hypothetical protein
VLVRLLHDQQRRLAEERQELGDEWQDHDLVFPSERGTPLEPSNLHRHFKAALKQANLPHTTRFHDLRHSCATFLIAQGVHPRVVMEILGHSQISLTMNTYGHVLPETQREATTKVADLFGPPEPGPAPEAESSDGEGSPDAPQPSSPDGDTPASPADQPSADQPPADGAAPHDDADAQ